MVFGDMKNVEWWRSEQKQQHELTQKRCLLARGENTLRGKNCRGAWPPQGSNINFYLLVIAVWERQDGANTALEKHRFILITWCTFGLILSLYVSLPKQVFGNSRDISHWPLELPAQVLYVLPLLLRQTPSSHEDVLHSQLLLIKQPLHNK